MADWLKIRHALMRSAKIRALMRELQCSQHTALGVAVTWLCWLDEQSTEGETHMPPEDVNDELGYPGAAEALCNIGWAFVDGDGCLRAYEFGKHCGDSAKKRAIDAQRVARHRGKSNGSSVTPVTVQALHPCNGPSVTDVTPKALQKQKTGECNAKTVTSCNGSSVTNVTLKSDQNRIEENRIKEERKVPSNTTVVLSADEPKKARAGKPTPSSADEVRDFMAGYGLCSLAGDELTNCAAGFFDEMEAAGWTGRNGAPVFDWQALARKYCRGWQQRSAAAAIAARKTQQPVVYRSELPKNYDL